MASSRGLLRPQRDGSGTAGSSASGRGRSGFCGGARPFVHIAVAERDDVRDRIRSGRFRLGAHPIPFGPGVPGAGGPYRSGHPAAEGRPRRTASPGAAGRSETKGRIPGGRATVWRTGRAARHFRPGKRNRLSRPASAWGQAGASFATEQPGPGGNGFLAARDRGPDDPHHVRNSSRSLVSGQGAGGGADRPSEAGVGQAEIRPPLDNPILADIRTRYPQIYAASQKAAFWLGKVVGCPIPPGEVGYLAMHFGAGGDPGSNRRHFPPGGYSWSVPPDWGRPSCSNPPSEANCRAWSGSAPPASNR